MRQARFITLLLILLFPRAGFAQSTQAMLKGCDVVPPLATADHSRYVVIDFIQLVVDRDGNLTDRFIPVRDAAEKLVDDAFYFDLTKAEHRDRYAICVGKGLHLDIGLSVGVTVRESTVPGRTFLSDPILLTGKVRAFPNGRYSFVLDK